MLDEFLAVGCSCWVGRIQVLASSDEKLGVAGFGGAEESLGAGSLAAPPAAPSLGAALVLLTHPAFT